MYNYSIIIPHKNIPELLERCLSSIPQRKDVEVIIVDDNSNPKIVDFARFPGMGRPHTRVIFHKGPLGQGGSGLARNIGMDVARGRWLVFADADDFFHPVTSEMMDKYADSDADIVFFRHDSVDSTTLEPVAINTKRNRYLAELDRGGSGDSGESEGRGGAGEEREDHARFMIWVPWARFFRRQMIVSHTIRFDEVRFSNNEMFSVKAGYFAERIISDPAVLYCNVRREGSLIHEGRCDWEAMSQRFDVDYRAALFLASVGKGKLFDRVVAERWRELSQLHRRGARKLLPRLREVCSPRQVRRVRFEETMRRILNFKVKIKFLNS